MQDLWRINGRIWKIYEKFMKNLWRIYGGFMDDLWRIYGQVSEF